MPPEIESAKMCLQLLMNRKRLFGQIYEAYENMKCLKYMIRLKYLWSYTGTLGLKIKYKKYFGYPWFPN